MTMLKVRVQGILDDFEHAPTDEIVDVLTQITPHFKNASVSEYLQRKIQGIGDGATGTREQRAQCKALIPYLDWYLQGQ